MKRRTLLGIAMAVAVLPAAAVAADYPSRDIRVINPWAAGGGTDGIIRKLTTLAEADIGAGMYVENIEGGNSATGVTQLMKAKPDGYTIGVLTYDSVVTVPWQGVLPSYRMDKLKIIARLTSEPDAIIVDAKSPYQSVGDLLDAARQDPGKLRIAVQNLGGRVHLALLKLQTMTDTEFKIVSYPGGAAPQKEAILSDEVDVVITSLGDFANLIEDGTVRGVMEFSDTPNPTYPEVPTSVGEGIDLVNGSFILLAAPAGTPDDVIARIEAAYDAAEHSEDFQGWVAKAGVTPNFLGSDQVTQWADETARSFFAEMDALVEAGILSK